MDDDELKPRAEHITAEWGGIFAAYEAIYIHSVMYTADRCLEAFERYDQSRESGAPGVDQVSYVHEALGHAASLSRYFWTSGAGPRTPAHIRALKEARAERATGSL